MSRCQDESDLPARVRRNELAEIKGRVPSYVFVNETKTARAAGWPGALMTLPEYISGLPV